MKTFNAIAIMDEILFEERVELVERPLRLLPPLPPKELYPTFETAYVTCQEWAKNRSYALCKRNTQYQYAGGPYKKVYLICDRGGEYKSVARIRKNAGLK